MHAVSHVAGTVVVCNTCQLISIMVHTGNDPPNSCCLCQLQGVLYTHRSNFLHAMVTIGPDSLCLGAQSTVLMVVPMFHANSWGLNFSGGIEFICSSACVSSWQTPECCALATPYASLCHLCRGHIGAVVVLPGTSLGRLCLHSTLFCNMEVTRCRGYSVVPYRFTFTVRAPPQWGL